MLLGNLALHICSHSRDSVNNPTKIANSKAWHSSCQDLTNRHRSSADWKMKDECNLLWNARGHLDFDYGLTTFLTDLIRNSFNKSCSEIGWQYTQVLLTGSISISIMRFFTPSSLCSRLIICWRLETYSIYEYHDTLVAFIYAHIFFSHSTLKSVQYLWGLWEWPPWPFLHHRSERRRMGGTGLRFQPPAPHSWLHL